MATRVVYLAMLHMGWADALTNQGVGGKVNFIPLIGIKSLAA